MATNLRTRVLGFFLRNLEAIIQPNNNNNITADASLSARRKIFSIYFPKFVL